MPNLHDRLVQLERLILTLKPDSTNSPASIPSPGLIAHVEGAADAPLRYAPANGPLFDPPTNGRSESGSMRVDASALQYVGEDHWVAILDSIADLKDHVDREDRLRLADGMDLIQDGQGNSPRNSRLRHALLLYGNSQAVSRAEILEGLPPKSVVDRYVSRYFNRIDLVANCECPLLHCRAQ